MKWILSIFLCLPVAAAYRLNTPLSMSNTGATAEGSDHEYTHVLYYRTNGEPRVMYGLRASGDPCQCWDFGLSNSISRVVTMGPGFCAVNAHIPSPNGWFVYGTTIPGVMTEYRPTDGATNYVKACSNNGYYSAHLGTDGDIHFGTYGDTLSTSIETYHSATRTVTEWGKLNTSSSSAAYVYYVGGDTNYVYGVVLDGNNWYLGAIQRSTGAKKLWWTGTNTFTVRLAKGMTNNNWYVSTFGYFQMDGTNDPIVLGSQPNMEQTNKHSNQNNDETLWASEEGWEVEPAFAVVNVAGSIPQTSARFRKTSAIDWTSIVETNGWLLGPYLFNILRPVGDKVVWTTRGYGPIGYLDTGNVMSLIASQVGISWYDIYVQSAATVFFSGYHNTSKRWLPGAPWTWTISTADDDTNANPRNVIYNAAGKYHLYATSANDGRFFVAGEVAYGTTEGFIGWWNPSDESNGYVTSGFSGYPVRDLKPSDGGSKLVYVSGNSDGRVSVWNVATDTVTTNFSPLGATALNKVVEYESGKLIGVTGQRTFAFTSTGSLIWTNSIPATAWQGFENTTRTRITLGPDGYVWQCAGGALYRINPQDGSYVNVLTTTNDYNTAFLGGDIYLYGGSDGGRIWLVNDALTLLSSGTGNMNVVHNLNSR